MVHHADAIVPGVSDEKVALGSQGHTIRSVQVGCTRQSSVPARRGGRTASRAVSSVGSDQRAGGLAGNCSANHIVAESAMKMPVGPTATPRG